MGVLCAKLRRYFCSSCCCFRALPPPEEFQVLLLGPAGSGKTELGHRVSGRERGGDDLDPTNGVRCYRLESAALQREDIAVDLQLTEPVLLVAKRHREGVQLYDVEHSFGLDQLARSCGCPLHICHMDDARDLGHGIVWLCRQLVARRPMLEQRVRYDVNMQVIFDYKHTHVIFLTSTWFSLQQVWHRRKKSLLSSSKMAQVHRGRFRRPNRKLWPTVNSVNQTTVRPSTAPPTIFLVRSRQEVAPNPEQAAS
ncbi:GL25459 [Drosophila persimilis]|uniref:GL25459 n=1 Tax=Drosophila persimilis TaxID=7234 RepID=B4GU74_DROPE|nr:GL25459 [Drosophila persimilis]